MQETVDMIQRDIEDDVTIRVHGLKVELESKGVLKRKNLIHLGGSVDSPTDREKITKIAQHHAGDRYQVVNDIEANTISTSLGARADVIEISKNGEARGPLISREVRIQRKASVEDIYGEDVKLERDCRAGNVYARRLEIESGSRISGEVRYTDVIDVEDNVTFTKSPEKVDELPAPPTENAGVERDEPPKA